MHCATPATDFHAGLLSPPRQQEPPERPSLTSTGLRRLGCTVGCTAATGRHAPTRHAALSKSFNPKVVQKRREHATVSIKLDMYSHVTPSIQQDAANRTNSLSSAVL